MYVTISGKMCTNKCNFAFQAELLNPWMQRPQTPFQGSGARLGHVILGSWITEIPEWHSSTINSGPLAKQKVWHPSNNEQISQTDIKLHLRDKSNFANGLLCLRSRSFISRRIFFRLFSSMFSFSSRKFFYTCVSGSYKSTIDCSTAFA